VVEDQEDHCNFACAAQARLLDRLRSGFHALPPTRSGQTPDGMHGTESRLTVI
jgi:hypothetical protein